MDKYICGICATIYNPELGTPDENIAPGTAFEDLPDDWRCPICGSSQDKFTKLSQEKFDELQQKGIGKFL